MLVFVCLTNILLITSLLALMSNSLTKVRGSSWLGAALSAQSYK